MPIDILILLRQALHDPSSGAARSIQSIGQLLARARTASGEPTYRVRALGTTATDAGLSADDGAGLLRQAGYSPECVDRPYGRLFRFDDGGVHCTLLGIGGRAAALTIAHQNALDQALEELTADRVPDIVLTFGASPTENERRKRLHARGAVVLFAVCNWGYLHAPPDFFTPNWGIDAVLFASEFQRRQYAARIPLPVWTEVRTTPLIEEQVMATETVEPRAVVFVNPAADKGVLVFVRLADELAKRRPDIPLLVVESRGTIGTLWAAAHAVCIDLSRHPRLRVIPSLPLPRDVFARAKILLMPSVWAEPSGRLVGEALLNGIPPIVSDRGGLPDECRGAGFVIPLPAYVQPENEMPPSVADIEPWIATILRLWDSPEAYAAASAAARQAGEGIRPEVLQMQYEAFFARLAVLRQKP